MNLLATGFCASIDCWTPQRCRKRRIRDWAREPDSKSIVNATQVWHCNTMHPGSHQWALRWTSHSPIPRDCRSHSPTLFSIPPFTLCLPLGISTFVTWLPVLVEGRHHDLQTSYISYRGQWRCCRCSPSWRDKGARGERWCAGCWRDATSDDSFHRWRMQTWLESGRLSQGWSR